MVWQWEWVLAAGPTGKQGPVRLTGGGDGPSFTAFAPGEGNIASNFGTRRNPCRAIAVSWMLQSGRMVCSDLSGCPDHKIAIKKKKEFELTCALITAEVSRGLFL